MIIFWQTGRITHPSKCRFATFHPQGGRLLGNRPLLCTGMLTVACINSRDADVTSTEGRENVLIRGESDITLWNYLLHSSHSSYSNFISISSVTNEIGSDLPSNSQSGRKDCPLTGKNLDQVQISEGGKHSAYKESVIPADGWYNNIMMCFALDCNHCHGMISSCSFILIILNDPWHSPKKDRWMLSAGLICGLKWHIKHYRISGCGLLT